MRHSTRKEYIQLFILKKTDKTMIEYRKCARKSPKRDTGMSLLQCSERYFSRTVREKLQSGLSMVWLIELRSTVRTPYRMLQLIECRIKEKISRDYRSFGLSNALINGVSDNEHYCFLLVFY